MRGYIWDGVCTLSRLISTRTSGSLLKKKKPLHIEGTSYRKHPIVPSTGPNSALLVVPVPPWLAGLYYRLVSMNIHWENPCPVDFLCPHTHTHTSLYLSCAREMSLL